MSEPKSKLPDLQELSTFTKKLVTDIKNSITGILEDYKKSREQPVEPPPQAPETTEEQQPKKTAKSTTKSTPEE